MKKIPMVSLLVLAGLAAAPTYAAEPSGPYVSLGAGLSVPEKSGVDFNTTPPTASAPTPLSVSFDKGYIFSGAGGYRWDGGWRTELELNYRRNTLNDIGRFPASGKQGMLGVMGNLLVDLGSGLTVGANTTVQPYLGAGVGMAWTKWSGVKSSAAGSPTYTDRDNAWQWQMIGGLSAPLGDQLSAFTEYRYMGAINNRLNSAPAGFQAFHHSPRSHNLLVGVRLNFGSEPKKEVAAAPPPPPAPPPPAPPKAAPPPAPPVPQKFIVFFDFDKSNVRADAQKIVDEAAAYAKKTGKAVIRTTGHADTSGSVPYNLALSERRAVAVKAALVKLGIPEKEIVVLFKGESEPLLATGDGVKEPQNRRVEIVMD